MNLLVFWVVLGFLLGKCGNARFCLSLSNKIDKGVDFCSKSIMKIKFY